jgi:F420-dependent oxidoreductase-like protein
MRIGIFTSYSGDFLRDVGRLPDFHQAGVGIVYVPEAYSFDAPSQLGYLAAAVPGIEIGSNILPIYTRTPTLIAMTAAGLDYLSGARFTLGLGASGPQVIEGFHGVAYDAPIGRTRDIIEICRSVWRRDKVEFSNDRFSIPLTAERGGSGLGKSLKLINTPVRPQIPIMVAAMGPRNVAMAAELAQDWAPFFFQPEGWSDVWGEALRDGFARRDKALGPMGIIAPVALAIGEDVDHLLDQSRPILALYIGGMGAKGRNFYHDLACRYGYAAEADLIQQLYLSGRKDEAAAAVPLELIRRTSLIGPRGFVAERIAAFAQAGVTTLTVTPLAPEHSGRVAAIETLADLL